jgi:phage shock protein C
MENKRLLRSNNRMLAGVCAGIAEYFGWEVSTVRIVYALATIFTAFSGGIIYLILWIVSLFLLAAYLILVEYMDYNLQEKLSEINDEGRRVDSLIGLEIDNVPGNLRNVIQRIDDGLNSEAETRLIETKASGEETQTVEKAQTAEETEGQKDADAQAAEEADAQKDADTGVKENA